MGRLALKSSINPSPN